MFGIGLPEVMVLLLFFVVPVLWIWAIVDISTHVFDDNNKVIWLLVVIFVPILGVILYFTVGRGQRLMNGAPQTGGNLFCANCGKQVDRAPTCIACGTPQAPLQSAPQKNNTTAVVLTVVAVVFLFFIIIGGILAAIAIPQFSAYRIKAFNAATQADLKNVKIASEVYFADHNAYPESFAQLAAANPIMLSKDVTVDYQRSEDGKRYIIYAQHAKAQKMFCTKSEDLRIFWKLKDEAEDAYQPL